jgi:hypothetical protein
VAGGEAARAQERLGLGPAQADLQRGDPRHLVEPEQAVEPSRIERDDAGKRLRPRLQAAHDRRPAPERHHCDSVLAADPERLEHLLVGSGQHDQVGRGTEVARAHAQQVGRRLAAGVTHPGLVAVDDIGDADRGLEHRPDGGRQAAGRQRDRRDRPRAAAGPANAEGVTEQAQDFLGQLGHVRRIAPA